MADDHVYTRFAPLLLLLAAGLVYANSLNGDFIYDDVHSIVQNPDIRSLWPPQWLQPTDALHEAVNSRPMASFTLVVNYAFGGLEMPGYRLFNIAVHLLCGLALYGVVRRTAASTALAFACALLWLVHPLQSQCINYIIQRRESLASLFYLLALYSAIRGFDANGRGWYAASILSCILGVASKEIAATAPFAIALYDRVYRSGSWAEVWRRRHFYIGFAAPLALLVLLIWGDPHGDSVGFERVGVWTYLLNQCVAIVHYLRLIAWPHPLLLDYGPPRALLLVDVTPQALLLSGLLALCSWGLLRHPRLAYPGLWFFILLAPSSSVIPIAEEWAAERRVYLALAGPLALVCVVVHGAARRVLAARALYAGLGLALCAALALGVTTRQRNGAYRSGVAIWQSDLARWPDNPRALRGLAFGYQSAGDLDAAIGHYRQALQIEPDDPGVYFNLGLIYERRGDTDAAIQHYARAVALVPNMAKAHNNLGAALKAMNRFQQALTHYRRAVEIDSGYVLAHKNLALLLVDLDDPVAAVDHLVAIARLRPDDRQAQYAAGKALQAIERWEAAAASYRRALAIDPDFAAARQSLAGVLQQKDVQF